MSTGSPTTTLASFTSTVSAVTPAEVAQSWRPGCPVAPDRLRRLTLGYWGLDGRAHRGTMVVDVAVVADVVTVFDTLYGERFPVRHMQPVDVYGGSDDAAAAADDTSVRGPQTPPVISALRLYRFDSIRSPPSRWTELVFARIS